ncbi:MAG: GBS Bsp-like repeat-containing protein [Streptococcus salivarius]
MISDVYSPKGVVLFKIPVWSEKEGQDDIRWYEATRQTNGTYAVMLKLLTTKFNRLVQYSFYYILNDGSQVGVGGTTTTLEFRNAKTKTQTYITNVNSEAGSFTVVVDQAPQDVRLRIFV